MKKIINILSIAGIIASPLAIGAVYIQANSDPGVAVAREAITKTNFPLNQPQIISFKAQEGFDKLTERQQLNQLRDWLLLTVVSGKGISAQDINKSTYDLPTVRYDYVSPVANFEYGQMRSVYIGEGKVIALLPKKSSAAERKDFLGHIADRHRKDQGQQPKLIEVYEYEITTDKHSAILTRLTELDAAKLFSSEYGYYESKIQNVDDLNKFLNQLNDITFAEVNGLGLMLGGRKLFNRQYKGINTEDIAALWQSDNNNLQGSGFSLDPGFDYASLDKALEKSQPLLQALKLNGKSVITDQDIQKAKAGLSRKDIFPYRKLINKLQNLVQSGKDKQAFREGGIPDELKRELEPYKAKQKQEFDAEVKAYENKLRKQLEEKVKLWQQSGLTPAEIQQKINAEIPKVNQEFQQIQASINRRLRSEHLQIVDSKIKAKLNEINNFLDSPDKLGYQAARYDGNLQGTEVGMVLFYTDLLTKLWALNYLDATPTKVVPDFNPLTKLKVSSIYKDELEKLSYTRLWFGPQDKGFQVGNNGNNLLFARNATRIYAASSDRLNPGKETIATADTNAFLSWWNDHYEEVARHEPQYERLNQIMKWSLVINWLNQSNQGNILGFLQNVSVKRDNWFSDWVKNQGTNLRFQQWEQIGFYPRGYKGTKTEAMQILASESYKLFGKNRLFKGGVSLPNKKTFDERIPLPNLSKLDEVGFRSNIDYKTVNLENGQLTFKNLEGTTFKVENQTDNSSQTVARAKPETKLRSPDAELTNLEFTRKVAKISDGIEFQTTVGDTDFGNLQITKTGNGFEVGFISQDIDAGYSLISKLIQGKGDILTTLKGMDEVEAIMQFPLQPNNYIVKLSDSERWVKISNKPPGGGNIAGGSGGAPPVDPPNTYMLVGELDGESNNYVIGWLDKATVKQKEAAGEVKESFRKQANIAQELDYTAKPVDILKNPAQFIAEARKRLNNRIQQIDKLLISGKDNRATRLIDDSIQKFGNNPDLMMRKAIIYIRRNRIVVGEVTATGLNKSQAKATLIDQINKILASNQGKFRRFENNTEFIYMQDSPELNNLDPSQPIEQSVPFSSGVKVYKLEPGKVGDVRISLSGFGDVSASSNPSTKIPGGTGGSGGSRGTGGSGDSGGSEPSGGINPQNLLRVRYNQIQVAVDCQSENREDEQKTEENEQRNDCLPEKPVYVVISAGNK